MATITSSKELKWELLWLDTSNTKVATTLHFYNHNKNDIKMKKMVLESLYIECFMSWVIKSMNLPIEGKRKKKYPHEYIQFNKLSDGFNMREEFYDDPLQAIPRGRSFKLPLGDGNFEVIFGDKDSYRKKAKEFRIYLEEKKGKSR